MMLTGYVNRARVHYFGLVFLLPVVLLLASARADAQYLYQQGAPTWTTSESVELGYINAANGDLHIQLPVTAPAQRGKVAYSAQLVYDSRIWQPSSVWHATPGWRLLQTAVGTVSSTTYANTCTYTCGTGGKQCSSTWYSYQNFKYVDNQGTSRQFPIYEETGNICHTPGSTTSSGYAIDGSGYYMSVSSNSNDILDVFAPDGVEVYPQLEDTNGNCLSTSTSDNGTCSLPVAGQPAVDTLNRTPLTSSVNGNTTTYTIQTAQGSQSVVVTYTTVYVHTQFGQSGVTEYQGHFSEISSVQYPDAHITYDFSYDTGTSDTDPSIHYGELTGITLATGGTVSYGYTNFADANGTHNMWVSSRSSGSGSWAYTPSTGCGAGCQKVTVVRPSNDQTVYTFNIQANGDWRSSVSYYNGSSTLLETLSSTYQSYTAHSDFGGSAFQVLASTTATVPAQGVNLVSSTTYAYDSYIYNYRGTNYTGTLGRVTTRSEYAYGSGASGPLTRKTVTTYQGNTNLPTDIQIQDGSGNRAAETSITYDNYNSPSGLTSITGVSHHNDSTYGVGNTTRNNPTEISRWISGSNWSTTTLAYDTTGQVLKTYDGNSNPTTLSYGTTAFCSTNFQNAYVTSISNALSQASYDCYDFDTGLLTSSKDPNGATTSLSYDEMDRPTGTTIPDGGTVVTCYASSTVVDVYTSIASAPSCGAPGSGNRHDQASTDGFGRVTTTSVVNDPGGQSYVATAYDSSGRVSTVSNPYRSVNDPTYGTDTYSYDGLNRVLSVLHTDRSSSSISYGGGTQICSTGTYGYGIPATYTDESGNPRRVFTDAFGRVIEVDEPDPTSGNSLTLNTCYSYNRLDELTAVSQGSQSRSYGYDGLGRLTSSATPETAQCAVTFGYDNSSNLTTKVAPKEGQSSCATTVTTTYGYDALNRLTSKSYNDSITPSVTYYYDQTSYNGLSIVYGTGRRTGMSDGSGQTAWSFDPVGRVAAERRTIAGITKQGSYAYNMDGSLNQLIYDGSGRIINYTVNTIGQPTQAQQASGQGGYMYSESATYAPQGGLGSVVDGYNGSFNGITATYGYDNRLRLATLSATSSSGTAASLGFSYYSNSNVNVVTNNRDTGRTATYTYDALSRLVTGSSQATTGNDCWGQSIPTDGTGYDRYGNLKTINSTKCSSQSLGISVDTATNRINSANFSYDAAGNLLTDGVCSYTWDAEGRQTGSSGSMCGGSVTYVYDGDGRRVKKSTGTLYWYDTGSSVLTETDLSGNLLADYVYFAGMRLARVYSSSAHFYFGDQIGSTRVMTGDSGIICYDADFYPFGGEHYDYVNSCSQPYKFAGMERDSETQNDHTMFRYYASNYGRWLSPDQLAGDISNPQSLNRYAYVLNNPTTYIDPLGLTCTWTDDGVTVDNLDGKGCSAVKGPGDSTTVNGGSSGGPGSEGGPTEGGPSEGTFGDMAAANAAAGSSVSNNSSGNGSGTSWIKAFASDFMSNFSDRFNKSCFGQFLKASASPVRAVANQVSNIPGGVRATIGSLAASATSIASGATKLSDGIQTMANARAMTAEDAAELTGGLATAAAVLHTANTKIVAAGNALYENYVPAVLVFADGSMLYGVIVEAKSAANGNCE